MMSEDDSTLVVSSKMDVKEFKGLCGGLKQSKGGNYPTKVQMEVEPDELEAVSNDA